MPSASETLTAQEKDFQLIQLYLNGFDFVNVRVIKLRNEWTYAVSACRGTPP